MKKVLNLWSGRRLSILGRIAIVKTLALSKLVYNCSVLDTPTDFAKEVNKVIFPFMWNFKPDKIKRKTLTGPISKGGLNTVNFADVEKSLKATGSFENEALENEDRSTKHPKLENEATKSRKRSTYRKRRTRKRSTQNSKPL